MIAALPQFGYAVFLIARPSGQRMSGAISKIGVPLIGLLLLASVWYFTIVGNEHNYNKLLRTVEEFGDDNLSVGIRVNLLSNGIAFCLRSGGLGIGASGFPVWMQQGEGPFPTRGIINPHSFLVEILSQYGIVVFICFLAVIYSLWRDARRYESSAQSNERGCTRECSQIILVGMLSYFLASLASSSFMKSPINWIFLGSLLSLFARAPETLASVHMPERATATPELRHGFAQLQRLGSAARRAG